MKKLKNIRSAPLYALVAVACGCGAKPGEEAADLVLVHQGVQLGYVSAAENDTTRGVNLITTSSTTRIGKSTGSIRFKAYDGFDGNCGVTFISHRYALTAAHCVPYYRHYTDPPAGADDMHVNFVARSTQFTVEQYTTTGMTAAELTNQALVSTTYPGGWPNYVRPNRISAHYTVQPWTCTVEARCSFGQGVDAPGKYRDYCPASIVNPNNGYGYNIDTALLRCDSRPTTGLNWVPFRSADPQNLQVEVWWFHEVVNLATSTSPYSGPQPGPDGNAAHYYAVNKSTTASELNNYHYNQPVDSYPQVLPLRSKWAAGGVAYTAANDRPDFLGYGTAATSTNVYTCHGMSGSGVFEANTPPDSPALLGHANNSAYVGTTICDPNMANGSVNLTRMSYIGWETDHKWESYMTRDGVTVGNDRQ